MYHQELLQSYEFAIFHVSQRFCNNYTHGESLETMEQTQTGTPHAVLRVGELYPAGLVV